ncbi:MAG: cadmium-translocating P-type ATPase [Oscillospiraceae bacterium]|nr:cadmium-translocating P-type ATPase [Candidatus Limimonas egerieequi]
MAKIDLSKLQRVKELKNINPAKLFNIRFSKADKMKLRRLGLGILIFLVGLILYKAIKKTIWVGLPFLIIAYIILSIDVVFKMIREIKKKNFFSECLLMIIASLGAFVVGEYPEAAAVMILYQIGEMLEDIAVDRSERSIAELMDIRPDVAYIQRGELQAVHPSQVSVGERIVVRPGERIPLDGEVTIGESYVDTSAITGEPTPRHVVPGSEVLSGFINNDGVITIKVTKPFAESTATRVIEMVKEAGERKAPAEQFITKFSRYYTPAVIALALIIAVVPSIILKAWKAWVYRGLICLVIACPCAIVISVPLAFFAGLGVASRNGILIKGSNYLEALNNVGTVVFDKTGTLTKGVFGVTQVSATNDYSESQLLTLAAYAECQSNHPIAKSIMDLYYKNGGRHIDRERITDYKEIPGHGLSVVAGGHLILAGNAKLMRAAKISITESTAPGTRVYIAADGKLVGYIIIDDEIRDDARETVLALHDLGVVHTAMLTGDNASAAANVARNVGIEKYYAELLPEDKVEKLEEVMNSSEENGGIVAFVGDGINDAPVLARADIGIAMGGIGSDAAVEAADVVLMEDNPSKVADAIAIASDTKMIVKENIIGSLVVKLLLFLLGLIGIAGMWFAVFADVGVMILAVVNSMRLLKK